MSAYDNLDIENWSCPLPLRDYPLVVMGHGGGGRLSSELIENLFLPAFGAKSGSNTLLAALGDATVANFPAGRLAMSTDSYVVRPRFFPGGNIGDLAVNGTVNDLAVSGATPLYMSAGFILEEGVPIPEVGLIAETMGKCASIAGVQIITGDTKVVDKGHGDGVFINTAGVGVVPDGIDVGAHKIEVGDSIIVSGGIGLHGVAILSVREGLEFGSEIRSDTASLVAPIAALLKIGGVHAMRDCTRGGLAASLHELAGKSSKGVEIVERSVPVPEDVRAACGFLGLDPMLVANEGRFVAFVRPDKAEELLAALKTFSGSESATIIGTVVADHPGVVVAKTGIGGTRIVDLPLAEQLPRIC